MKRIFTFGSMLMACAAVASAQTPDVATFENLALPDNSYWCGELTDDDEDMGFSMGEFASGDYSFNNFYWPDYYTWAFFAYSSRTEKTFKDINDDQFNSVTGSGAGGSRIFGVAFPASYLGRTIMTVGNGLTPAVVPGMEIVNTAWVVDAILNGDGYEGKFVTGDWLKLILTGILEDEETVTREYYLADYTSDDPSDHYYIDTWTWIDMSVLGEVNEIEFSIDSSKKNAYGVTTPTYVCIDNVGISQESTGVNAIEAEGFRAWITDAGRHIAVGGAKGKINYIVSDLSGKIMDTGSAEAPNASLDLSSLPSGVYIIKISDNSSHKNLKVFIR